MYLMKESNCSVIGGQKGYDLAKYSDINLTSRSSISYLYLTQLISYDSLIVKQGLLNIYLTQIAKFTFYFIIEFINNIIKFDEKWTKLLSILKRILYLGNSLFQLKVSYWVSFRVQDHSYIHLFRVTSFY